MKPTELTQHHKVAGVEAAIPGDDTSPVASSFESNTLSVLSGDLSLLCGVLSLLSGVGN
jgi:hypothetical protein